MWIWLLSAWPAAWRMVFFLQSVARQTRLLAAKIASEKDALEVLTPLARAIIRALPGALLPD